MFVVSVVVVAMIVGRISTWLWAAFSLWNFVCLGGGRS